MTSVRGMRVFIPGGAGRLAVAVADALTEAGAEVWAPSRRELDLLHRGLACTVDDFGPDRVVLAAALTQVDACERDPDLCRATNVEAVERAIAACRCPGIYVSTDYVFGGMGRAPYAEDAPRAPINVYGKSKADAEELALAAGWAVARTAWLWGDGQGFARWVLERGRAGGAVQVADQVGTPTVVSEVAAALVELLPASEGVHHLVGATSCSRAQWAAAVLDKAGLDHTTVLSRPCAEIFAGLAPRPQDTSLLVSRPSTPRLRGWREALTSLDSGAIG